jgi:class 3 adenylate cyclase/CHASE2 domain-containing sensor protein
MAGSGRFQIYKTRAALRCSGFFVYHFRVKLGSMKQTPLLISAGVIGLACALQLFHQDFLDRLERITYDWRVRLALNFPSVTATNLGFVNIGDDAITLVSNGKGFDKRGLLGRPYGLAWPRHIYGRMVNELNAEGAKAMAFDVLFSENRPDHDDLMVNNAQVTSDEFFGREIKAAGDVILASQQDAPPAAVFRTNALAIGDIETDKDADGTLRRACAFRFNKKWHRVFEQLEADPDMGIDLRQARIETNNLILPRPDPTPPILIPLDRDGNFDLSDLVGPNIPAGMARFSKPFTTERIWNMGIVLAAQDLKLDLANPKVELNQGRITLSGPNGVQRVIPVDSEGYFYIDWSLPVSDRHHRLTQEPIEGLLSQYQVRVVGATNDSAAALAEFWKDRKVDWRGKLVVVGSTATGNNLTDLGATPLEKNTFLVSSHWNVANSVLAGRFITRSSIGVEMLLIILAGIVSACFTRAHSARVYLGSIWVVMSMVIYTAVTIFAYVEFRYWMPLVLPVGELLGMHSCLLGYLVFFEQVERRRLRSVFTRVVSPDIVDELMQAENLSVKGAQRNITVFFSDIRGFTEMTDLNRDRAEDLIKENDLRGEAAEKVRNAEAEETLETVNLYLKVIANVVLKHSGTVDKFIGDCVMAFWGAPVANPHHALNCVRAAIETQRVVFKLNQEREAENRQRKAQNLLLAAEGKPTLPPLALLVVGTGINTGVVTVGLMGSDEQANYTVFGREVNLASRLETVSGRGRIIISETTLAEILQDDATLALSCKALPPVQVKGIRQSVKIFEVPWREGDSAAAKPPESPPAESYNTGYFTAADQ